MADQIMTPPMREVESRIGVQPIHELMDERQTLIDRTATLKAEHGPFGTWDHQRKNELARIAQLIRAQALRDKVKMTAAEVDDAAHEHPDYRDLVTAATSQRAELYKVEGQIEAIDQTVRRANAIVSYLSAEARMG